MRYGVLLLGSGMPVDSSSEAVREYAEAVFGSPLYQKGLGAIQGQMFKKVTVPAKAREWTRYFEGPGRQSIEEYGRIAESLRAKLERELSGTAGKKFVVEAGMLCGSPSVVEAAGRLKEAGCEAIVLLPLCPFHFRPFVDQALSVARDAIEQLKDGLWNPRLKEVRSFSKNPAYVKALAERIRRDWEPRNVSRVLILTPSQPRSLSDSDDAYEAQVTELRDQLQKHLKIGGEHIHVAYLCEFDNAKWIGPFAEKTLLGWVGGAVRDVRAVSPAFCLPDALGAYDSGMRLGDYFKKNVMGKPPVYHFVPSFDDSDDFVKLLGTVIRKVS